MELVSKERQHVRLPLLVVCVHMCPQPIRLHDSLMINIPGKNQLRYWFCLHGIVHEGKVASETTAFVWVWPGVPPVH